MSISNQTGFGGFPVPIGTVIAYAGIGIPSKYLKCDGSAFNAVEYPYLASILGVATTPNLIGSIIGGGSTKTLIPATSVVNPQASLSISADNMPFFPATLASFSATGSLAGTGINFSALENYTGPISLSKDMVKQTGGTVTNVDVTFTGMTAELVPHAQDPVQATTVTVVTFNPPTRNIVYIIKASY